MKWNNTWNLLDVPAVVLDNAYRSKYSCVMKGARMANTVAEIGRLAGCSSATVSRAMNNSGSVSASTRAAVLRALREVQYIPKAAKRRAKGASMRGTDRELIEIVLHRHTPTEQVTFAAGGMEVGPLSEFPDEEESFAKPRRVGTSFYRRMIDGAVEELSHWGHRAVLQLNHDLASPSLLKDVNLPDRRGVLLFGEYSTDLSWFIQRCQHPLVLVDLIHDGWPDVVTTDNMMGVSAAFDHLHALGHRKIGFTVKNDGVVAFAERFLAFKMKMAEVALQVNPSWVYTGSNHIEMTAKGVQEILSQPDRPTAFVCSNDCAALAVLRAANNLGIRVPQDLSVVGFDDEESASMVTPALTTVRVPVEQMGRQAVRQLMIQLHAAEGPNAMGCRVRLLPELIVRQSTAKPAGS
jgi:LacI family transcriptional regulator